MASFSGGTSFSAPSYQPNIQQFYGQVGLNSSGGLNSPSMYRPVYDAQTVNRDVNLSQARQMQAAQGQTQRMRDSLMGRGFGSNSPFALAQGQNIMSQARASSYQDETQRRMRAAEANFNGNFQYDQLRQQELMSRLGLAQGLSGQGLSAWQTQYSSAADLFNQQQQREQQLKLAGMDGSGMRGRPGLDPGWIMTPWGASYAPQGGMPGAYR